MIVRECTWCRYLRSLNSTDMAAVLEEHIRSLPEDMRCGDEEHARRLALCADCEKCRDGLCAFCGCYVAVRTAKKALHCPYPCNAKW